MNNVEDMDTYRSPLGDRYGSTEMSRIFSPCMKFRTWRRLWIALAEGEYKLGVAGVTREKIDEMKRYADIINYDVAERIERETHHDVMAHIRAYGEQCPNAAGIIHLGATSCYITDNTDVIIMKEAINIVEAKLNMLIDVLTGIAFEYKDIPTLAYTHYQPAQPTTVGKRVCLWIQDFKSDLEDLRYVKQTIKTLGCKGATGTQASFLELFNGDYTKVEKLEMFISGEIGIETFEVTGQTYPRKLDKRIYDVLSSIAVSASKMANDIRLLQHDGEMREPFGSKQVGSSAMAYKKNPLNCEKIVGLSRRVITDSINPAWTASVQWLERTLDDSSNRRLVISEGFLTIDEVLDTCIRVISGIVVNVRLLSENLAHEAPFMVTENIMMSLVSRGMNRQKVHEEIRRLSMHARVNGGDLLKMISDKFGIPRDRLERETMKNLTGCASKQVEQYLKEVGYEGRRNKSFD